MNTVTTVHNINGGARVDQGIHNEIKCRRRSEKCSSLDQ